MKSLYKNTRKPLTFVLAAIQLEVSLSSSHFLIHFFNHCQKNDGKRTLNMTGGTANVPKTPAHIKERYTQSHGNRGVLMLENCANSTNLVADSSCSSILIRKAQEPSTNTPNKALNKHLQEQLVQESSLSEKAPSSLCRGSQV